MLNLFKEETTVKHKNFKFWQEGNHTIELFSENFVWDMINYIHNNPVEAGLVKNANDWVYSSASNYQEMESIIEIERLQQRLITY